MKYIIRTIENSDTEFYALIGPLLSRRDIVKDQGGNMWDDDGKVWFAAVGTESQGVMGVCAYVKRSKYLWYCSDYVLPGWRGQGVYNGLFVARDIATTGQPVRSRCTPMSVGTFTRFGFITTGMTGSYADVSRTH